MVAILWVVGCAAPGSPSSRSADPLSATGIVAPTATAEATGSRPTRTASTFSSAMAAAPASSTAEPIDPVFSVMTEVITASRPTTAFELSPDRLDGSWILDGNAIDALGRGRLYVVVTPRPGDLLARPCGDPDFRQGGACAERALPDGSRLVIRDRVTAGDVTTVLAVVIHPDRSGITAESSDASIGPQPSMIVGGDVPRMSQTRATPPYTAAELAELIVEIDRRLAAERLP